ncbi:hypothetical protein MMO38_06660 [Acinetobacter sp. NIPH 1852]|uniref:hypothetical protein n=1 Tax=Acinetobacter sp. NIPH 1852 TaxID=2923428 RepID=UPI001F4B0323|nr:hypothetical protein [Acinetobacter sp. NIPH 1852]MCH7307821.1 hypothetical protein [Acinetobacter sp. NIPH 1852]
MSDLENQEQPVDEGNPTPTDPTNIETPAEPSEPEKDPSAQEPETKPDIPETADEYKVELDGFDFDAFKADESNKAFLDNAHQAGLTNEQLSVVMQAFDQHTAVQVEALQDDWGGEYEANLRFANQAIQAAGLQTSDVDSPTFGIRLAAYFGKALQEDMPPQNTQQSASEAISELIASEAYMNESHPDHKRVYAQVQSHYSKLNG